MISTVEPGSIAEHAGIMPGDELVTINGRPVRDVIDFRFYTSDIRLDILMRRGGAEFNVEVDKDFDSSTGIGFTAELFDGIRICDNRCVFCFVDNLPRGMRNTLYIKDDDYRLSFLHGNFVTLTNLSEDDVRRVIEQRLSPLYVSVHATETGLRERMVRSRHCADIYPLLRRLADSYVQLHTQIVLCSGLNDGAVLDRTIDDLSKLYPAVQSIGVVPVGMTKYNKDQEFAKYSNSQAAAIIRQVAGWQRRFRRDLGTRLVFASDELYLLAECTVPGSASYEGYPQYENGIGIVRSFVDDLRRMAKRLPVGLEQETSVGLVTGKLAEPFIRQLADSLNSVGNLRTEVFAIINEFFGETVTVAGLVVGEDVSAQLQGRALPGVILIPNIMLRDGSFLDGVTVDAVSRRLGVPVVPVDMSPAGVIEYLSGCATTST